MIVVRLHEVGTASAADLNCYDSGRDHVGVLGFRV